MNDIVSFDNLASNVARIHELTSGRAKSAVNQLLTARNWAIGYYIVEYEQKGADHAEYGSNLIAKLAERLAIKGIDRQALTVCRAFYNRYPQIRATVSRRLVEVDKIDNLEIVDALKEGAESVDNAEICATTSRKFETDPETLITRLSFSHIREMLQIEDSFERFFYEFECIQGNWSVRELRRQIATNLYVRAGISKKPELLLQKIQSAEHSIVLTVKEPYALEFLGLDARESITESDLEKALIDHLQEFMLELGSGFCFEARHKRILIDGDYYFPDLVFYNRILHCNVIIELKNEEFSHENLGQLNAYVGYYKENEMHTGDNPPVGILLCTKKGPKMVEYALSGMDNQLFVSTYMLQLPDKARLEEFLLKEVEEFS